MRSASPAPMHAGAARLFDAVRGDWGSRPVKGRNDAGWHGFPGPVTRRTALGLTGRRQRILSDAGTSPGDIHLAAGVTRLVGDGYALAALPSEVEAAIGDVVAVVMLTEGDHRTDRHRNTKCKTGRQEF